MAEIAYKAKLYPTEEQRVLFNKTFGCSRFVYNKCLDERMARYEATRETFDRYKCAKFIVEMKKNPEYKWLKEVDSTALQRAVEHLDEAYQRFFKHLGGYPKFKKKSNKQSYTSVNNNGAIKIFDDCIQLPKVGKVKCKYCNKPKGRVLNATVSRDCSGEYFVSVCCTDVEIEPLAKTKQEIGIDMGQHTYCTFSNGDKIENPEFLKQASVKVKRASKNLSRKTVGSKNREKARIKLAKTQAKIAAQRSDFQHKLSKQIVKDYDIICIETLDACGMTDRTSKSAKKRKNNNKSLKDRAYGEFNRMLTYKAKMYGKTLVKVDKYFASSQICSDCGYKNPVVKDLSVREWICPECGHIHDRDVNAAINILNEGLKQVS